VPWTSAAAGLNPYYNGRNILIEEFFHTVHHQARTYAT
jgi:hypothetical protein